MSRRGRSGPTISLFAFQDIITSVTAIFIVVILLLTLDLAQRRNDHTEAASSQLAADLAAQITEIHAELAAMRKQAGQADAVVREVAAVSPSELRDEILRRTAMIASLSSAQKRLEKQRAELHDREKRALAEQFDLEPVREQRAQLDRETGEIEREIEGLRRDDRRIYSLPKGFQGEGWLVVIEADRILVAPLGRAAKPVGFSAKDAQGSGASAADAFVRWIDAEHLASAYFLLLVRPGGASSLDEVEATLSSRNVSFGFDLVGTEARLLHPERGAAP